MDLGGQWGNGGLKKWQRCFSVSLRGKPNGHGVYLSEADTPKK
jgi:hypothetical protein